ncbi:hypothetical protein B0O99DRAFT_563615 [Bisporella sp. PMI_857]|nr:hypothetical protein B0O99DRAFT_563615 [Bisporella sp. PMI_857]
MFIPIEDMLYHAYTAYLFTSNNLKDIVAARLSMGPSVSPMQMFSSIPAMILWSWNNLFLFNLHNQRHPAAIAEDAMNKPWRPLPATRITYSMYPVVLIVALMTGGLAPCLIEAVSCLWYNEWGGASDPFLKNALNGLGFACFLAGPLEVATGRSVFDATVARIWLVLLTGAITTTVHTQDFRDVKGDRAVGRLTLPLLIGDKMARAVVVLGVPGWTAVVCWFWGSWGWLAWAAGAGMIRSLLWDRSWEGNKLSWKLWAVWMVGLFLVPLGL